MPHLRQKMVSGLFWSAIERFGQQGIQLVITIIIARILSNGVNSLTQAEIFVKYVGFYEKRQILVSYLVAGTGLCLWMN